MTKLYNIKAVDGDAFFQLAAGASPDEAIEAYLAANVGDCEPIYAEEAIGELRPVEDFDLESMPIFGGRA